MAQDDDDDNNLPPIDLSALEGAEGLDYREQRAIPDEDRLAAMEQTIQDLRGQLAAAVSLIRQLQEQVIPRAAAAGAGDLVYVALTKTGGADGNKTATPSYTYSGTVAGTIYTGVTPAGRIWGAGRFVEASVGIGRRSGGSLTLLLALEQKRTKACP